MKSLLPPLKFLLLLFPLFLFSSMNQQVVIADNTLPILFSDDFESDSVGSVPSGWSQAPTWYDWRVAADPLDAMNQVATTAGFEGSGASLHAGDLGWGDQQVSVRLRWNGDDSAFYWGNVAVRTNVDRSAGYFLQLREQAEAGRMQLYLTRVGHVLEEGWISWDAAHMDDDPTDGIIDPTQTIAGVDAGAIPANQWVTVMLRAKGNKLQAFVNGNQVGPVVTDYLNVAANGRFGIGATYSPIIVVDDVVVEDLTDVPIALSFTANDSSEALDIVAGESVALNWEVVDAQSVSIKANGVELSADALGTLAHVPTENTVYELTAVGSSGNLSETIEVNVHPVATIDSFTASAAKVVAGTAVTLNWTATQANSVLLDGLAVGATGSLEVTPTATTTYELTAVGGVNTATQSLTVDVGTITDIAITPDFLPDLEDVAGSLPLGVNYVTDNGLTVPVEEAIDWTAVPNDVVSIDGDGYLTVLDSSYQGAVAVIATMGDYEATRYLYQDLDNLFSNASFEQDSWWRHWRWEGSCARGYDSEQARTGNGSFRLHCDGNGRVGFYNPALTLSPGRYRLRGYERGLAISESGLWGRHTDLLYLDSHSNQDDRDLLHGTFGWTPFEATYTVASEADVTFYTRLFAAGTLWLDDLSLTAVHPNEPDALRIGQAETDPPSACENDLPLCVAAPTLTLSLTDFASGDFAPFAATSGLATSSSGGELRLNGSGYLDAWEADGLATDWQGYDYLTFTVENEGSEIVDFYVEIRDHLTTGYWSRVNWYDKLVPGENQFHIPLQIFVGERIAIQEQRRLDLSHVTRLVLSFSEAGSYRLSDLVLTEEPFKCSRPEAVKAFDFGTTTSPRLFGFDAVLGSTSYAQCRGYGLENATVWRSEDRRHPDPLWRDWLSFQGAGGDFVVDLADGAYQVTVFWEDAGYWEYYQNYLWRSVAAEGTAVCHQTQSYSDFLDNYYRHQDHEDLPAQDGWATYIASRYQPSCNFLVTVTDGQLNLDFDGSNPYAATVNGVVVYPTSEVSAAQAWLANLDGVLEKVYNYDHKRLDLAGEQPDVAALPDGEWVLFKRPFATPIYANTVPEANEITTSLSLDAAKNERAPVTFALYPQIDLGNIVSASVSGVAVGTAVSIEAITYLDQRVTTDGTVYGSAPALLKPVQEISLDAGLARRFVVGVEVGETAVVGHHDLQITLQTSLGKTITLPLTMRVLPVTLPEQPVRHSVLGSTSLYPGDEWGQTESKMWNELPDMLGLLEKYGLNALTGFQAAAWDGSNCDSSQADSFLAALAPFDFDALINSYAGRGLPNLTGYFNDNDAVNVVAAVNCSVDAYATAGYTLSWSQYDEPGDVASLQTAMDAVNWYEGLAGINGSGFQSSGYHSVYSSDTAVYDLQRDLFTTADFPFVTLFDEASLVARNGRSWGLYNQRDRFGYGFYGWMLHKKYGLSDITAFALQSVQSDPYYALDSREADFAYVYTTRSGDLRPTIWLEELALGINDFRYLTALETTVSNAPTNHSATLAAQAYLDTLLASLTVAERAVADSATYFSSQRSQIVSHLLALAHVETPPTPPDVAIRVTDDADVMLSWTHEAVNYCGYAVYQSADPYDFTGQPVLLAAPVEEFVVETAVSATAVWPFYRVAAVDCSGGEAVAGTAVGRLTFALTGP
ncbi:MAG: hypothetical protein AAF614_27995 [Chloroflexota bacterium]